MNSTKTLLASLLAQQESEVLEFKERLTPDSLLTIASTVTAFLNTRGGTIIIGFSEQNGWIGVDNPDYVQTTLEDYLPKNIAPEVTLRFELVEEAGRRGVVIEVPPGGAKPYVFEGAIYVRREAITKPATPGEITRLVQQRSRDEERWERQPAVGIEAEDLDTKQIDSTLEAAVRRYSLPSGDEATPFARLDRLDLATDGWPRNAAIVLFLDESGRRRYPQLAAHTTVFLGDERRSFADDKVFEGNAFELFDRMLEFAQRHISVRSTLRSGDTIRTDRPAIPVLVLREAILNAIAHREYRETSPIQLRLLSTVQKINIVNVSFSHLQAL